MHKKLARSFSQYLKQQEFSLEPATLYDPINYFMNLGGKRMRPQLCLLSCALFSDQPEQALPQAYAVELFHNFTLVHDDIMDEAPLRRGKQTVHEKYDVNTAILSGDVMLIHCYDFVQQGITAARAKEAVRLFSDTAIRICQGQQYDMDFERGALPTMDEYLDMIRGKTAILLGCAMALGGLVAGQQKKHRQQLFAIGEGIGMAFQVQDDILDVFGSGEKTGKVEGGDILQGKKTFLYLRAVEVGGPRVEAELASLYSDQKMDPERKVDRVREIYNSLGVLEFGERLKATYYEEAMHHLERLPADEKVKKVLIGLFSSLLVRDH